MTSETRDKVSYKFGKTTLIFSELFAKQMHAV